MLEYNIQNPNTCTNFFSVYSSLSLFDNVCVYRCVYRYVYRFE